MGLVEPVPPVVFFSMPFAEVDRPSLALSLLRAELAQEGIASRIIYANIRYASRVGPYLYQFIAGGRPATYHLLGEWVFSPWLDRDPAERAGDLSYLDSLLTGFASSWEWWAQHVPDAPKQAIGRIRREIDGFLAECVSALPFEDVKLVGFTSCFQQQVPSLVLARLLKERYPHLTIVFGGANVEGSMGKATVQAFPWVDVVVSGEGDRAIVELARAVLSGQDPSGIPGVITKDTGMVPPGSWVELDSLPYPEYDDYFEQWEAAPTLHVMEPSIMLETSRGCWWGQKSHCTFCGLNGLGLAYRSKSPARAVAEILALDARYGHRAKTLIAADNIVDYRYFDTVLPTLAARGKQYDLFYETKANLRKTQVEAFDRVGFRHVQPGIESLSTPVLRLMRKGTTAIQNVQVLKWFQEFGILASWNVLTGFPGEQADWYRESADLAQRLYHLAPPVGSARIRLDRFSPLFDEPDALGVTHIRPRPAYRIIFPDVPDALLFQMAYYFDFDEDPALPPGYTRPLEDAVVQWKEYHHRAGLFYWDASTRLVLVDTRREVAVWVLDRRYLGLLDALDSIRTVPALVEALGLDADTVTQALRQLDAHGWIVREGGRHLSLAIKLGRYQPKPGVLGALASLVRPDGSLDVRGEVPWPAAAMPVA
jgi:ribosomal peptide maturation radical SAM protein 1